MPLPPFPPNFDVEKEFPILRQWSFFNHAAVAPLCARAAEALRTYAAQAQSDAYLTGKWYRQADQVRKSAALIIHAEPSELAFIKNTSEGLAFVANGLSWNPGDEILSTNVEYPANVYPWMDLQNRLGVRHIMLPEGPDARIPADRLFAAVTGRTRMIALSHVEYASGFRHDLHRIGQFCREKGILLCVDAIQSIGCLPVDVKAMQIDFLSADGHKWMLGPEGLGFFYCRKELIPSLRPEMGWMNVTNATDYGHYDLTLRSDAKRFECGSYNIPGVLALGAALQLLLEVGIDTIWQRVDALNDLLAAGLIEKGYRIVSPRSAAERSGILAFASPAHDHNRLVQELESQKIILALREGRLCASLHFYQSESHVRRLLDALPRH